MFFDKSKETEANNNLSSLISENMTDALTKRSPNIIKYECEWGHV